MATPVTIPNTFAASAVAEATTMNQNFKSLQDYINTSVMTLDASRTFTALPNVPASDPTTDPQLARGRYIEKRGVGQSKRNTVVAVTTALVTNPATTTATTFDIAIPAWVATVTYKIYWSVVFRCTSNAPLTLLGEVLCEGVVIDSVKSTAFEAWTANLGGHYTFSHSMATTIARGDGTHTWLLRVSKIGASPVGDFMEGTNLSVISYNDDLTVL